MLILSLSVIFFSGRTKEPRRQEVGREDKEVTVNVKGGFALTITHTNAVLALFIRRWISCSAH